MLNVNNDTPDEQRTAKAYPASTKLLSYLWNVAEREGMDAEALAGIHCKKDMADLTEDEATALIELINT